MKRIYVVDEASMVGNTLMRDFLRMAANEGTARVVLVGDVQQLDAVDAGTPFAFLQNIGMPKAVMADIQRQKNETALAIVNHAIAGDIQAAFKRIGSNITETSNVARDAALQYLAMPTGDRERTGVLTPTNKARVEINEVVREGLKQDSILKGEDVAVRSLTPIQLTRAQLSDPDTWVPGDVALAYQSYKTAGVIKGHIYDVLGSDSKTQTVFLQDRAMGQELEMPLSQSSKSTSALQLFEEGTRDMAVGEQVRFRITDAANGITNAQRAEVTGLENGAIQLRMKDGQKAEIDQRSLAAAGMDHAYALTGHGFQGATVDRILVAMSSTETLADQKSFYVAVSRARDTMMLVTDNAQDLSGRLTRQTGQTTTALEAWLAAQLDRSQEDQNRDLERPQTDQKPEPERVESKPSKEVERREPEQAQKPTTEPTEKEPQKRPDDHSEKSDEHRPETTNPTRRSKRDILLAMVPQEDRDEVEKLAREIQQKQRGDFER